MDSPDFSNVITRFLLLADKKVHFIFGRFAFNMFLSHCSAAGSDRFSRIMKHMLTQRRFVENINATVLVLIS